MEPGLEPKKGFDRNEDHEVGVQEPSEETVFKAVKAPETSKAEAHEPATVPFFVAEMVHQAPASDGDHSCPGSPATA